MIELRAVTKVHAAGTAREVKALDRITLSVDAGSFAAVVGESGSGKTTLLTILGALDTPTAGEVRIDGTLLDGRSRAQMARLRSKTVGFIFQGFDLIESLSATENVELAMRYSGVPELQRRRRAAALIADVGLTDRASHLPGQLSGGQQQRVAIARALANHPAIVLADEPTGELDSETAARIVELLRAANRRLGITMIVVTHNEQLAKSCDPVVRLRDGRLVS
ncbi:MAG: ABC transporter ATP-binding protein [Candidatus Eremiobacteraeota bacterium]|nr:ABC transporter ATP-binding protein [Candidatus Eremiobacteraeota bacterium]